MKKIIVRSILGSCLALLAGLAHADMQRCVAMKPDLKRLACFDIEMKLMPSGDAPRTTQRSTPHHAMASSGECHTGPRGGRYRIVNGHKRYGC